MRKSNAQSHQARDGASDGLQNSQHIEVNQMLRLFRTFFSNQEFIHEMFALLAKLDCVSYSENTGGTCLSIVKC
jgi:hypothetical protein